MNTDSKTAATALVSDSMPAADASTSHAETAAPDKKKAATVKPNTAPAAKTSKATPRPQRRSQATVKSEELVCRYCGSDDLAPSFRKRRDARCRACFKKRYGKKRDGAAARGKRVTRIRKARAAR